MDSIKARGLVTRRREYGEASCMLTIIADGLGVISASCYGVKSKKSRLRASTQPFTCADFVFSKNAGGRFRVEAAEIVDAFYPICEDVVKLSLANYLCELSMDTCPSGDDAVFSLLLNTLYVAAYRDTQVRLLKAVFEIKLAELLGYAPAVGSCIRCGSSEALSAFDTFGGTVCAACRVPRDIEISEGARRAIFHILTSDGGKIFAFSVSDEVLRELGRLSEKYILSKSERSYKSLDYLKNIM